MKNEFSPRYPESLATLEKQLGAEQLATLQNTGSSLTIEQLIELAELV